MITGGGSGGVGSPTEICGFYTPLETDTSAPEPASLSLLALATVPLLLRRKPKLLS